MNIITLLIPFERTQGKEFKIILMLISVTVANSQLANRDKNNGETIIYSDDDPPKKCTIQGDRLNVDNKFIRRLSRPELRELAQYRRSTDRRRRPRSTRYDPKYDVMSEENNDDMSSLYDSYFDPYSDNSGTLLNQGYDAYNIYPYYYPSYSYYTVPYVYYYTPYYTYYPLYYNHGYSYTTSAPQTYSFLNDVPSQSISSIYKTKIPSFCSNLK